MIEFRCWYCHKRYDIREQRIGERFPCTCGNLLRVPKCSGGNCRVKTVGDWIVETILYGGGGALLGFGLAVLCLIQMRWGWVEYSLIFVAGLTLGGFLVGLLGGARGIDWLGDMIRHRENDR